MLLFDKIVCLFVLGGLYVCYGEVEYGKFGEQLDWQVDVVVGEYD